MAILKTKIALESRVIANFPSVPIAPEGVTFFPSGQYFRVNLQVNKPTNPLLGSEYRRENMVFQVFCVAESNKGTAAVITLAEQVQEVFKRGTFLAVDNLRIHVFSTPHLGSIAPPIDGRIMLPVRIPITVEVQ